MLPLITELRRRICHCCVQKFIPCLCVFPPRFVGLRRRAEIWKYFQSFGMFLDANRTKLNHCRE